MADYESIESHDKIKHVFFKPSITVKTFIIKARILYKLHLLAKSGRLIISHQSITNLYAGLASRFLKEFNGAGLLTRESRHSKTNVAFIYRINPEAVKTALQIINDQFSIITAEPDSLTLSLEGEILYGT